MTNLIESWIAAETTRGKTEVQALADLNEATGLSIDRHRVHHWKKGSRQPSKAVSNYMLSIALPHLLPKSSRSVHQRLIESLSFPDPPE